MSFVQPEYIVFLALVFAAYWLLGRRRRQNLLLIGVSFVFYGWVHPEFCLLLVASSVVDYLAARGMGARPARKSWLLAASVAVNMGMLAYFKYVDFFIENFAAVMTTVGLTPSFTTLNLVLPLGISFFTFQTMSYTIDVWRGQLEAREDFVDYMVFVTFFPQLVAGPVERAANVLPQIEAERSFDLERTRSGFALVLWGAFKKICVADTIAPYVDLVFLHSDPSAAMIWAGGLGFAVQILADFSGYTDLARGSARMLGIELMENFESPYLAATPAEYWQRWHISFSTWLRDYVYLPATFSPWVRRWITVPGTGRWGANAHMARAFFITMLISGVWHGASWICIFWGLYHAVLLTAYHLAGRKIPRAFKKRYTRRQKRLVLVPLMFLWTWLGMIIFRERSLATLVEHLTLNPLASTEEQWITAAVMLGATAATAAPLVLAWAYMTWLRPRLEGSIWRLPLQTTAWAAAAVCVFTFKRVTDGDFVYFQF